MWLILCQDEDAEAGWLAERLRALELAPVELVRASELVHGARWEHRLGSWGARTVVTLADGRVIDTTSVAAVVNRLVWLSAASFAGASLQDREYAGNELQALVLSWLQGFGSRAVNRPSPLGLCGGLRTAPEWRWIAHRAGLKVEASGPDAERPSRSTLVVDGVAVTGRDAATPTEIRRLAEAAELDVFGANFVSSPDGGWEFVDVDMLPSIQASGDAGAEAVARVLCARAEVAT